MGIQQLQDLNLESLFNGFDFHIDPIVVTDANLQAGVKILYVNDAFCKATGYNKEEVLGQNPKMLQGPKSDKKTLARLKKALHEDKPFVGQTINYRKDGSEYILQWSVTSLKDKNNQTIAFMAMQKILTKYDTSTDEKLLLKAIVEHAPGMILVTDLEGNIVYVNDSFCRNTGYKEEQLLHNHTRMLKSGKQSKKFYENMWHQLIQTGKFEGLFISKKKDNTLFYDKKKITVIKDEFGNPKFYLAVSYDVTKDIESEKTLRTKVYQDSLTGVYNREKYNLDVKELVDEFKRNQRVFSMIIFDIDHFKGINDNLGHDVGDFILKELTKLVIENIRGEDKLYRWGGEEFIILVKKPLITALSIANKLKKTIREHDFNYLSITASFGVSQINENLDAMKLFKQTDNAMYKAKQSGRDRVVAHQ
ncbi:MAG: sensor domain-containing diguanylate cyclase [Campylobacterota bacterium]